MDTTKVDDLSQPGRTGQRHVRFEGVVNFRDLGGYQVASGGQTKWGVLFRSDALHRLTTADLVAYERLGIRTVYDLRSEGERTAPESHDVTERGTRAVRASRRV